MPAGLVRNCALASVAAPLRQQLLFTLDADTLHRPGPRMLEGTRQLCARLAQAREVLKK